MDKLHPNSWKCPNPECRKYHTKPHWPDHHQKSPVDGAKLAHSYEKASNPDFEYVCEVCSNVLTHKTKTSKVPILSALTGKRNYCSTCKTKRKGIPAPLYCPHCGVIFEKLVNCRCKSDADMVVIGLTPKLDFNNSISFCNVTGCINGTFIKSGDVIRHVRLWGAI